MNKTNFNNISEKNTALSKLELERKCREMSEGKERTSSITLFHEVRPVYKE